jgi:uncharacterized protein GlcG (DUF336 family)
MARAPLKFKQSDVTRAVKAARAAGLNVGRIEIDPSGRIVLVSQNDNAPPAETAFDQWKAWKNAHAVEGH